MDLKSIGGGVGGKVSAREGEAHATGEGACFGGIFCCMRGGKESDVGRCMQGGGLGVENIRNSDMGMGLLEK